MKLTTKDVKVVENPEFRTLTEHFYLNLWIVVGLAGFMALAGLYCVYGGIKILLSSRKQ